MAPHAGYKYSGPLAGKIYAQIEIPETVLLLGVNHQGLGSPYAIDDRKAWETPLGLCPLQRDLGRRLQSVCADLNVDYNPFELEHSLEVHVPFLQYAAPSTSFVPIAIGGHDPGTFERLGQGIAEVLREWGKDVLIIASSDMTHYESARAAETKDQKALEAILKIDPNKLLQRLSQYQISMCGYAPTAIMLHAAKGLGAKHAKSLGYTNSGDATGDYANVVAYAGVSVF
jgi:MEMO1 family protein